MLAKLIRKSNQNLYVAAPDGPVGYRREHPVYSRSRFFFFFFFFKKIRKLKKIINGLGNKFQAHAVHVVGLG